MVIVQFNVQYKVSLKEVLTKKRKINIVCMFDVYLSWQKLQNQFFWHARETSAVIIYAHLQQLLQPTQLN